MTVFKRAPIIADFKHNWLFLSILAIGTIPSILHGYSIYLLVLLFPIILFKSSVKLTGPLVCSFIYGLLYTIPLYLHQDPPTPSNAIFYMIYPALFYMIPSYLMKKFRNPDSLFMVLIMVVTCIASWSISVNIEDTMVSGELVNMKRALAENLKDIQGVTSATNHNMMLSMAIGGIGLIFITAQSSLEKTLKIYLIALGALAIFSAFHLLNRTAIVLAIAACFVALFTGGITIKRVISLVITLVLLGVIFYFVMGESRWMTDVLSGFESRETHSSNYGIATGGGRGIRWMAALEQIPNRPIGDNALYLGGHPTYAHNTWLDCAIQSGWLPLLMLLYITGSMIVNVIHVLRNKRISLFKRAYIAIVMVVMLLQLMVEPGIQGVYLLVLMMFFVWSYAHSLNLKYKSLRNEKPGYITYCS